MAGALSTTRRKSADQAMKDRQAEAETACADIEHEIIGWLLAGAPGAVDLLPAILAASEDFHAPNDRIMVAIGEAVEMGLDTSPKAMAMRLVDDDGIKQLGGTGWLLTLARAAPALPNPTAGQARVEAALNSHREATRAARFAARSQDLLESLVTGAPDVSAVLIDVLRYCDTTRSGELGTLLNSCAFVEGFVPPDYLMDGVLQRGFAYSLTGATGAGKTTLSLRLMAHVESGSSLAGRDVAKGRVLMLVGENADDVRCRWIALAEQMGFFPSEVDVHFVPSVFSIRALLPKLRLQADKVGGFALVVVDTSAAYFSGEEENSNKQAGDHARDIRALTTLPGKPCVVVNCHPTKNASDENLLPRGGGAFIAEMDGNLTCSKKNGGVELHWQGKYRGPEFEPMAFELLTVTSDKLRDSRQRHIPTVIARPLSEAEQQAKADAGDAELHRLMQTMSENVGASVAALARAAGWVGTGGVPHKSKVSRLLDALKRSKFAAKELNTWVLTPAGLKAAKRGPA
jgi:hypothetical protein